jgi:hypothetical protein
MRRLITLVLSAAVLAGCTSSGHHGTSSPPSAPPGAALAKQMRTALSGVRSAQLNVHIVFSGQSLAGTGAETLHNGRLRALRVDAALPGGIGTARIVDVGGKVYAKLPAVLNPGSKPYVAVTPASHNQTVQLLQPVLGPALAVASVGNLPDFVQAADSVTPAGKQTLNGIDTRHYTVVVNVAKLPAALPARQVLGAANVHTLPVQLYVNSAGLPAEMTTVLSIAAQQVRAKIDFSRYNQPATITAPPASQVDTG